MNKLFLSLVGAGSILFTTPAWAHKAAIHDPPKAHRPHKHKHKHSHWPPIHYNHPHGHRKYPTHNHCHYHYKRGYSHCHRHRHGGPGKGHHGNKWFHGTYPYSLEFHWYTH